MFCGQRSPIWCEQDKEGSSCKPPLRKLWALHQLKGKYSSLSLLSHTRPEPVYPAKTFYQITKVASTPRIPGKFPLAVSYFQWGPHLHLTMAEAKHHGSKKRCLASNTTPKNRLQLLSRVLATRNKRNLERKINCQMKNYGFYVVGTPQTLRGIFPCQFCRIFSYRNY